MYLVTLSGQMESSCPNSSGLDPEAGWEPRPGLGEGEEAKAALAHWSGPKGRSHNPRSVPDVGMKLGSVWAGVTCQENSG